MQGCRPEGSLLLAIVLLLCTSASWHRCTADNKTAGSEPFSVAAGLPLTYSSDVVASTCAVKLFRSGEPTNVLYSYEYLLPGQSLATGDDALVMQSDCNLVLYRKGTAIWASGTSGRGTNCILSMQNDGDLVIYQDGDQVWNAGAGGKTRRHYVLALGRDGNLGIYGGAVWDTNTSNASLNV